jgi:hypothetical protein
LPHIIKSFRKKYDKLQLVETKVENQDVNKPRGLLVSDLTAVVIRGVSAAIVVFLAVEGGLAIFSANGGEPNPYVLLLTCLVAAVFSEHIWSWMEQDLLRRLNANKNDKPEENKAPEEIKNVEQKDKDKKTTDETVKPPGEKEKAAKEGEKQPPPAKKPNSK